MKTEIVNTFDFADGVEVSKDQIKEWHEEVLKALRGGLQSTYTRSGNSMVVGFKHKDHMEIFEITNGYVEHTYTK